jgi:hypothetical protein
MLEAPDEYQNIFLKIEEILSLIKSQNERFERSYLDLLFEHFYYCDILDGIALAAKKRLHKMQKRLPKSTVTRLNQ